MGSVLFTLAILVIVLGILVFVHELGHYLAAKLFGVWVHRFAIGIGKPIAIGGKKLSFHRGETEWAIAWLPLGGYVKMASREEEPASAVLEGHASADVPPDRVFEAKPVWQRMVIILAGVTLNIVFGWLVFTGLALKNGRQYDPTTTVGHVNARLLPKEASALADLPVGSRIAAVDGAPVQSWDDIVEHLTAGASNEITLSVVGRGPIVIPIHRDALAERARLATALEPLHPAVVAGVAAGYPAAAAGVRPGDSIVAINDAPVAQWSDAVEMIRSSGGRPVNLTVRRDTGTVRLEVTPRLEHEVAADTTTAMVGRIGINGLAPYRHETLGLFGAIRSGADATLSSAGTIVRTFRGLLTRQISSREIGGPILIAQMGADQARAGLDNLLAFLALISINLAVVNLLPIPVLDGGAFLFLLVEGITRRPLPMRVREVVSLVGLAMVVLLMVLAFRNDIGRLLGH
jgi:regulator of sigma E protease